MATYCDTNRRCSNHPQLLATYSMQNPLDFSRVNVMRLNAISK